VQEEDTGEENWTKISEIESATFADFDNSHSNSQWPCYAVQLE
jgi:hypothetical protein